MSNSIQLANIIRPCRTFHWLRSCRGLLLIILFVAVPSWSPTARAVCQDGCLANSNTVLGDDALLNVSDGTFNIAIGYQALYSETSGIANVGIGTTTLFYNTTGNNNTAVGHSALYSNPDGEAHTAVGF